MSKRSEQAIALLKKYQQTANILLKNYLAKEEKKARQIDELAAELLAVIRKFILSGGKRLRPTLIYYAYLAAGGSRRQKKRIETASLSIEFVHAFLLIHDDIIDKDNCRHGVDTVHYYYQKQAKKRFAKNVDHLHFGHSLAIIAGDLSYALANDILLASRFEEKIILRALRRLHQVVYEVIPGQMRDIVLSYRGKASEEEIMKVYEAKTAYYTFWAPISLGYILAGKKKVPKAFREYALCLGQAFQIRDDILGIFGEEKKLGKPVGSDLEEGKQTLLVNYIFQKGSSEQKKTVQKILKKKQKTKKDLEVFQQMIKESGAWQYSLKKSRELVEKANVALDKIDFVDPEAKIFFQGIAEYIIQREV